MHSSEIHLKDGGTITAHHNGDFSGNVRLAVPASLFDVSPSSVFLQSPELHHQGPLAAQGAWWEIQIPFEVMEALVAEHILTRRMSKLESMSVEEVLYEADASDRY